MRATRYNGLRGLRPSTALMICVLAGTLSGLAACAASGDEATPYKIEDGKVDDSIFLGWRVFHSTCHGCHGVDALGTVVAPNLVERITRLSSRDFSVKVLSRYRITMSAEAAGSDDRSELRGAFLEQVLRRERGEVLMPAWEQDVNVKPHVLDIYAYLRARADGVLGPGRPQRESEDR